MKVLRELAVKLQLYLPYFIIPSQLQLVNVRVLDPVVVITITAKLIIQKVMDISNYLLKEMSKLYFAMRERLKSIE